MLAGQSQPNFRLLSITSCCWDWGEAFKMGFLVGAETRCQFWGDRVITHRCPGGPPGAEFVCMCGIHSHSSPAASISAGPLYGAMLMYSALLRVALHSLPLIGPHSLTLLSSSHLSFGCILPQRPGCCVWRKTASGDEKAFWRHVILYFTSSTEYSILSVSLSCVFFTVAGLFKLFSQRRSFLLWLQMKLTQWTVG